MMNIIKLYLKYKNDRNIIFDILSNQFIKKH